jgi:hypothetical protein
MVGARRSFDLMSKQRLGWMADKYKQTKVWDATSRLTRAQFPLPLSVARNGQTDCY